MSDRLPPTPTLQCERLVLRPLRMEDAPVIQRRFPTWEVVRFLDGNHVPWPYPADGAASHIADSLGEMTRGEKLYWAIALKDAPDDLIGRIDLRPDDGKSRDRRRLWLDPEHHGKGFMTEAVDRVTELAFVELSWPGDMARAASVFCPGGAPPSKRKGRRLSTTAFSMPERRTL